MENIAVVLRIGPGNFEQGFPVNLRFFKNGVLFKEYRDHELTPLPPAPQIPALCDAWSREYRGLEKARWRTIQVPTHQTTHHASLNQCQSAGNTLKQYLQQTWFTQSSFNSLAISILSEVKDSDDDSVPIVFDIDTGEIGNNLYLKKLPWHLWSKLFNELSCAEPIIGTRYSKATGNLSYPISVLSIYGGDEGLDTSSNKQSWQQLTIQHQVKMAEPLVYPSLEQLVTRLRGKNKKGEQESFQILFFAGHSTSSADYQDGHIQINQTDAVSITDLQASIHDAVKNGLKLAIFNSCDGLGIANNLDNSRLPVAIVMREPVPDVVAQKFLQFFLEEFAIRKSIYIAMRKAREKLVVCEVGAEAYPNAQWLPIICQSLSQPELIWPEKRRRLRLKPVGMVVGGVVAIAALLTGLTFSPKPPNPSTSDVTETPFINPTEKLEDEPEFSSGEERLFEQGQVKPGSNFDLGLQNYAAGKYQDASRFFRQALQETPNDPELLIYLNNAEAALKPNHQVLAVTAPINKAPSDSQEILRGVAQAQAKYNCTIIENIKTGIENPKNPLNCSQNLPLKIVIADHEDRDDWSRMKSRLETLRNYPMVLGVISRYNSSMTFNAEKFLNQLPDRRLPVISTTSTAIRKPENESSEYLFRLPSGDAQAAEKLVKHLDRQGNISSVLIVSDPDENYSASIAQQTIKELKEEMGITPLECDEALIDQCLQTIEAETLDAVFLFPPDNGKQLANTIQFVNEYKDSRSDSPLFLGGDTLYSYSDILNRWPDNLLDRLVVAVPWEVPHDTRQTADSISEIDLNFLQDAQTLWGGVKVNWRTALAFDATQLFIQAISNADCDETAPENNGCRDSIKNQLDEGAQDSLTGPVIFDNRGDRVNADWVLVQPDENSSKYKLL